MIAIAALLLVAPAGEAQASPAGVYEIHQMEMGGALELKRDGHFWYAFTYGAVDEEGEGDWTLDGKTVRLTSNPMPKAPAFELVRDEPAPKGELYLTLEDSGFQWGHGLEVLAADANDKAFEVEADETGRVDLSGKPPITAIAPEMPVHGPTGDTFPLTADRGHRLLFRFHANDLGKVRFDKRPLQRSGSDLLLERYGATIRFLKVRP